MSYATRPGEPKPLGATVNDDGVNFAIFSQHATDVDLLLFADPAHAEPAQVVRLTARTLYFWHVQVDGLPKNTSYAFRFHGPGSDADTRRFGHRFNSNKVLIDPYGRANLRKLWVASSATDTSDNVATSMRSLVTDDRDYDWEGDAAPNIPLSDSVLYELHVRGFTRSPSSGVKWPGTFAGLIEKLPHLKGLGITALELMPVFDFDEVTVKRLSPVTGLPLTNFWGYDPISFFAPQAGYCVSPNAATHVREFRDLVKAAHRHGLEIILDVVFNHTGEGDQNGPTINLKGIDNSVFYWLAAGDKSWYRGDLTGCGNALRCSHPFCVQMLADSLAYWVSEMHVDGFRFDLAAVLTLGEDGQRLDYPPIVWALNLDPRFANTKVIVEPFGGDNQDVLGSFPDIRVAAWNFRFKDTMRRFVRGQRGLTGVVATRFAGSSDVLQRDGLGDFGPMNGVSYLTCHDGFTLNDLVTYSTSHNEANGEMSGNKDQSSDNCGFEGPSSDARIEDLRARRVRNFIAILLLSQGVPMLLAGDECRRTQQGNDNPYLQDNEISWFDWSLVERHGSLVDFVRFMTDFRKRHPALRREKFFRGEPSQRGLLDIEFHGCELNSPGFDNPDSGVLAVTIADPNEGEDVHVIFNMEGSSLRFKLPSVIGRVWYRALDTALAREPSWSAAGAEIRVDTDTYAAGAGAVVVLVSKP